MSIDSIIHPYKYYAMCVCVCVCVLMREKFSFVLRVKVRFHSTEFRLPTNGQRLLWSFLFRIDLYTVYFLICMVIMDILWYLHDHVGVMFICLFWIPLVTIQNKPKCKSWCKNYRKINVRLKTISKR